MGLSSPSTFWVVTEIESFCLLMSIRSFRKLEKRTIINRELIWLINGIQPKYRVIANFRKDNTDELNRVFECFVDFCIKIGLCGKELIAVDGTKIEASASSRKHYSKNKI